jgi:isoleucyl-tRNA synthetase
LDVWFDSGVSYRAVLEKREELGGIPCQLYLEGSDQHRGWFQSSLIPAIALEGKPPFKAVLTHGHVVDSAGRKMSKSLGNVISPHDIIKDYGADILRLWVASSDYSEDIRISREMLARLSEAYRKIRNTARFILSNLYDFNPAADKITYANLKQIDKWALSKANSVLNKITAAYESFRFQAAYKEIYDFCNETLSMSYLDMIKGRLYTYVKQSPERRSAQTTIYEILNMLVRMMAPILVFTAEEIWRHMPAENTALSVSVHLLDWPECQTLPGSEEFCKVMDLIPDINKLLEEKRSQGLIGSSFDAQINLLTNNPERYKFLESLKGELCEIFKVSQVEVLQAEVAADSPTGPKAVTSADIAIEVFKAKGKRCIRCWNYSQGVGEHPGHNLLCNNCLKAIGGR